MQGNVLKTGASNVPKVSFNFAICVFSRNFETGSSGGISAVGPGKVVRRVRRPCISVAHPAFLQKKQLLWVRVACLYLLRLAAPAVFQSVLLPSAKPFPPIRKFILHRCSMRKRTLWLPAASDATVPVGGSATVLPLPPTPASAAHDAVGAAPSALFAAATKEIFTFTSGLPRTGAPVSSGLCLRSCPPGAASAANRLNVLSAFPALSLDDPFYTTRYRKNRSGGGRQRMSLVLPVYRPDVFLFNPSFGGDVYKICVSFVNRTSLLRFPRSMTGCAQPAGSVLEGIHA